MKFRCKQSGNIVEFTDPAHIESMKREEHYEVVEEKQEKTEEKPKKKQ